MVSEVRNWHSGFDLDSVPPVPAIDLPRPEIELQPTIHEAFRAAGSESPIRVPHSCANLASYMEIAKRVQEKAAVKEQNEIAEKHRTDMLRLADSLNAMFCSRNKISLALQDVIANLQKTQRFLGQDGKRVNAVIEELIVKSDGYFHTAQLRGVTYLITEPPSKRSYQMARGPILRNILESSV
jgi:exoribonuclease R